MNKALKKALYKVMGAGEMLHKFRERSIEPDISEFVIEEIYEAYKRYQHNIMNQLLQKVQPGNTSIKINPILDLEKIYNELKPYFNPKLNDIIKKYSLTEYTLCNICFSSRNNEDMSPVMFSWFISIYADEGFELYKSEYNKRDEKLKTNKKYALKEEIGSTNPAIKIQWSVPNYYKYDFSKITNWNDLYKKLQLNVFYDTIGVPHTDDNDDYVEDDEQNVIPLFKHATIQKKYKELYKKNANLIYNDYNLDYDTIKELYNFYKIELDNWKKDVCKIKDDGKLPKIKDLYPEYFLKLGKPKEIEELEKARR